MPRGDGTGPAGLGPMTGRGLGFCAGFDTPGFTKGPGYWGWGRGMGWGRGRGRGLGMAWGRRAWFNPVPFYPVGVPQGYFAQPPGTNLEMLKAQKQAIESQVKELQAALGQISEKISELEAKDE